MDEKQLKIYDGKEPYIFISYAHKDSEQVLPIIHRMQQSGYRVWMDLGIEVGTEWSNNIAAHLRDCSIFLAFISRHSVASENCLDEIAYAKSHKKDSILIFLEEDVVLPDGTEMQTARFQRMYINRLPSLDSVMESINAAGIFESCRSTEQETVAPAERTVSLPAEPAAPSAPAKKKLWVPLLAAVLAVVLVVGGILLFAGKKGSGKVVMSDNLLDYTFSLDGVVYQLPFRYELLTKNGWTISDSDYADDTPIAGMSDESFYMAKNGKELYVSVFNPGGNVQTIAECMVGGIEVEVGDGPEFKLAKNILPSATAEEIMKAFGNPTSRNTGEDTDSLCYGEAYSDEFVEFEIQLKQEYKKYSSVELNCFRVTDQQATETNEEVPAYLAQYTAPTALGTDFTSGIVEIGGDLYQFPAPVQKFLDNGWAVSAAPGFVTAGGHDSLSLSRDGTKIELSITNFAVYQTIPVNCAVVGIAEYGEPSCVVLPGNIKIGMTRAELGAATAGKAEAAEGYYSYYEFDEREFSFYASIDKATDKVTSVNVKNELWSYS